MAPLLARFLGFRLVVWAQVSSPVTILPRKPSPSASKRFEGSWQTSTRRSFTSAVSWGGTHLAETLWNCRTYGRYGVLNHDSYPGVRLFHALLRDDFPSR